MLTNLFSMNQTLKTVHFGENDIKSPPKIGNLIHLNYKKFNISLEHRDRE